MATEPTVGLTQSAVTVGEDTATVTATIALTTPGGGPLPCALTVSYTAVAGTASPGVDYRASDLRRTGAEFPNNAHAGTDTRADAGTRLRADSASTGPWAASSPDDGQPNVATMFK